MSNAPVVSDSKARHQPDDAQAADQRIEELNALVSFLHADVERHKNALARQLHDNLSGSVIAAMMDITWIEQYEVPLTPGGTARLTRIKDSLRESIDLARRLVEELRPTLLDSIGLFAALSWQFRLGCARAQIRYTEKYPDLVPNIESAKLVGLFRAVQEAFNIALQHESVTAIHLAVSTTEDSFSLELSDDGTPRISETGRAVSPAVSSIVHRARDVGATVEIPNEPGRSVLRVSIPLDRPNSPSSQPA